MKYIVKVFVSEFDVTGFLTRLEYESREQMLENFSKDLAREYPEDPCSPGDWDEEWLEESDESK